MDFNAIRAEFINAVNNLSCSERSALLEICRAYLSATPVEHKLFEKYVEAII